MPPALRALVDKVASRLGAGTTATHRTRQRQLARAAVMQVVLTGRGCFVNFPCPTDAPLVAPAPVSAYVALVDVNTGANALIHVRDGRLACFELHTESGEPRPEFFVLLSLRDVGPIAGGKTGRKSDASRGLVARRGHLTLRCH